MGFLFVLLSMLLCLGVFGEDSPLPALPPAGSARVARAAEPAAWRPMEGSLPVSAARATDGRPMLRMPCNFKGTHIERASWDCGLKLDLTEAQGIQFQLFCRDSAPIARFNCYLRSGNGWYSASFAPQDNAKWNTISITKSATRIEEAPAGWAKIETIRISAWRGDDRDTEFYIADVGPVGAAAPASIAVVRGESAAHKPGGKTDDICQYSQAVGGVLDDLGVPWTLLSDLDLTAERLRARRLVILPLNGDMPDEIAGRMQTFLTGGGKLIAFYSLPPQLRPLVGIAGGRHVPEPRRGYFSSMRFSGDVLSGAPPVVSQQSWNISEAKAIEGKSRVAALWYDAEGAATDQAAVVVSDNCIQMTHVLLPDDPVGKQRLLLAMVGHFVPDASQHVASSRLERIGRLGSFKSFDEVRRAIESGEKPKPDTPDAAADKVRDLLTQAATLREQAGRLYGSRKYAEAFAAAAEADARLLKAYCGSVKPKADERRAFWCHSAFGVAGLDWDAAIKTLADSGFTAILPNMAWGGLAYYESNVLPVAAEVRDKGDQIARCLAACKKYGLACDVWKVCWNTGSLAPRDFTAKMKNENRLQVRFDGRPEDGWLCPSNPANQKLETDAMIEIATKYDVHGIHFDYIRYPDADACYCTGCRERFEAFANEKVKNWPADTRRDDRLRRKLLDFRRENITAVVAAASAAVRKSKPNIEISAAVYPNYPVDRDNVGQDWKLWCEKGYLDFVCPMDYTNENAQFSDLVTKQLGWCAASKARCYPGIGLSCWQTADVCRLIEQIQITRRLNTGGFTIFNYGPTEAREIVPLCGQGVTRKQ